MSLLPPSSAPQAPARCVSDAEDIRRVFDEVTDLTVGLEEEVLLVDLQTGELVPRAADVLSRVDQDAGFKLELPAAQLELLTPPVTSVRDAARLLRDGRRTLVRQSAGIAAPIGCGAPPVGPLEGELNSGDRYEGIVADYRAIARRQLVCALQVHVGVRGAERALAVYNALRSLLPQVAALAANAPYQGGADTGLASVRPTISSMLPRQGVPPAIASWDAFAEDLRWGARAAAVPEPRRWWWELRPHIEFGTLEVRVADTQLRPAHTAAVAAFVHSLVAWLAARHDAGERMPAAAGWRIAENRWSAARDGIEGDMADLASGALTPTRSALARLIDAIEPYARSLGCGDELDGARSLCESGGAMRQRAFVAEHGVQALPQWLAGEFAAEG